MANRHSYAPRSVYHRRESPLERAYELSLLDEEDLWELANRLQSRHQEKHLADILQGSKDTTMSENIRKGQRGVAGKK